MEVKPVEKVSVMLSYGSSDRFPKAETDQDGNACFDSSWEFTSCYMELPSLSVLYRPIGMAPNPLRLKWPDVKFTNHSEAGAVRVVTSNGNNISNIKIYDISKKGKFRLLGSTSDMGILLLSGNIKKILIEEGNFAVRISLDEWKHQTQMIIISMPNIN